MRLAIPVIMGLLSVGAVAQDGEEEEESSEVAEFDTEPERCVRTRTIRRTRVIDERTVAFFMRNGDVYVNTLQNRCPQLDREERFAYTARAGSLCSTDFITVLVQFAGRLEPGFTCRLSEFVPSSPEAVDLMIEAARSEGAMPPVTAEPVELPPEDDAQSGGEESAGEPAGDAADDAQ